MHSAAYLLGIICFSLVRCKGRGQRRARSRPRYGSTGGRYGLSQPQRCRST